MTRRIVLLVSLSSAAGVDEIEHAPVGETRRPGDQRPVVPTGEGIGG